MSAVKAVYEIGHGLVSTSSLHLGKCSVLFVTLTAFEESLCAFLCEVSLLLFTLIIGKISVEIGNPD